MKQMVQQALLAGLILFMGFFLLRPPVGSEFRQDKIFSILHRERPELGLMTKIEIARSVQELSHQYGLNPLLILAIMKVESEFNPMARSNRGAFGLMQVRPIAVKDVAQELGLEGKDFQKILKDPRSNMKVGLYYFASLLKRFQGNTRKALIAYNRGPTAVSKNYKNVSNPKDGYSGKVLKVYGRFSAS